MTSGPEHWIMINRSRILHRFKLRQNAPLGNLFIYNLLSSLNFQNIIFKLRKNAQLSDLVLFFFSAVSTSITSFQIAAECTI